MYIGLRRYSDQSVLDAVAARQADIEAVLRGVPGFVAYYAMRSGAGGVTITVCEDQAGTTESTRRAAEWVRQNVSVAAGSPPEVTEGEAVINFSA
jgi:hypothetical protein